jgi:hypothetical protein
MISTVASSSNPCPLSESWKAWAVPWKLMLSVAGGRSSRRTASTWATASLSETPGRGLNEIVTDGSCPRCVTVSGPTPVVIWATEPSGTSAPPAART